MAREYRPNARESAVISKLDHAKEAQRNTAFQQLREHIDLLATRITAALIEKKLVETTSKTELETQIHHCLETLLDAEEFDVQYQTANLKTLVMRPHFMSLYVTAFIVEQLIDHRAVIDIYGTDEEIYYCVNSIMARYVPL
jgi:trans-aconitate methyltransferase